MSPLTILLAKRKIGMTLGAYKSRLVQNLKRYTKNRLNFIIFAVCFEYHRMMRTGLFFFPRDKKIGLKNIKGQTLYLLFLSFTIVSLNFFHVPFDELYVFTIPALISASYVSVATCVTFVTLASHFSERSSSPAYSIFLFCLRNR